MKTFILSAAMVASMASAAQTFVRSELPATLKNPWELTYGPDGYLWVSEEGARVSRIHPETGAKTMVYQAPDYSPGHQSECCTHCFNPDIGKGTLGLALHPDFMDPANSYIYYVYSYNNGNDSVHQTRFKIRRLKWDHSSQSVSGATDVVTNMPTGYDHLGGRLLAVSQNGNSYLYLSIGDNGVSETNYPGCYVPDSLNPNNKCQDPNYKSGKIHRFNIDGTVPVDNPLPGNSFYTRGHRNPQGLIFNPDKNVLYNVEHGDRSDDEINVLVKGMNYGWKHVRGYHNDNNWNGEAAYISSYKPYPGIANDALKEPLYAWCAVTQHTSSNNSHWGTVAPSDGAYYNFDAIPGWKNSLLVVTLKKGQYADREVYQFRLNADGTSLAPSTVSNPNPQKLFTADESLNGRLRDIALSPDGKKIFLINNGGSDHDKVTVYTYNGPTEVVTAAREELRFEIFPNPCADYMKLDCNAPLETVDVFNALGDRLQVYTTNTGINVSCLPSGCYMLKASTTEGQVLARKFVKN